MNYQDSSLKSQLKQANQKDVQLTLILGENELNNQRIIIKDMEHSLQEDVALEDIFEVLKNKFLATSKREIF